MISDTEIKATGFRALAAALNDVQAEKVSCSHSTRAIRLHPPATDPLAGQKHRIV